MAKRNIFKNRGKTYIFSNKGGGGESGITVTPLTVTENGTYTSAAGQAYSPVTVRVEGDVEVEDNKPVSISENGTVVINPTSGKDAMAKVTATVNVTPVLETKTITENGTYTPTAGKDGFSEVTVNVSGGGGCDSVPLYAWVHNNFAGIVCYTYTENPSVGDTIVGCDYSDMGASIFEEENAISATGENQITIPSGGELCDGTYTRNSTKDIVLQAGEGGGGALYCWKGAEAGTFYTASATPADEAPIYAVTSESGQPSEINEDSFRVKHYSNGVITVQEKTSWDEWEDYTSLAGDTDFSRHSEGDIVLSADIEENKSATIDVSTYNAPVEVTPSSGKAGMAKATVTLSNIPVAQGSKLYGYSEEPYGSEYTGRHIFATEDIDTSVTGSGTASLVFEDSAMDGMVIADENVPYIIETVGTVRFEGTLDLPVYRRPELDVIVDSGGLEIETEKTVSITQNGTYIINPTTGKDAIAKVTATVSVATATVEGTNLILSSGSVSGNTLNL